MSYSFIRMDMNRRERDSDILPYEEITSEHKASIFSFWQINKDLDFDLAAYYSDVRNNGQRTAKARGQDAYIRFDARIAWRPVEDLELHLTMQNLLDDQHSESGTYAEVPRSFLIGLTYKF